MTTKRFSLNYITLVSTMRSTIYVKQYSTSLQWEVEGGCQILFEMSNSTVIVHGAKQVTCEHKKIVTVHYDNLDQQRTL